VSEYDKAELLLRGLGITEPGEIDLEAIAYHVGVLVHSCPLDKCEARLIGNSSRAIARVNSRSMPQRQRFSIAHELGHWAYDRGTVGYLCSKTDILASNDSGKGKEARANQYAASLVMPRYLFAPRLPSRLDFDGVRALATEFDTSIYATTIRCISLLRENAILVVKPSQQAKRWFRRSPVTNPSLWPVEEFHHETNAFELVYGTGDAGPFSRITEADKWFSGRRNSGARIRECSWRLGERVQVLLTWAADVRL
jgi:Zn-dependent peptidase ImmA (M78 family)